MPYLIRNSAAKFLALTLTIILTITLLMACDNGHKPQYIEGLEPSVTAISALDQDANIDWFNGGIESAFAQAKLANKPLFLYWGAEWCPPCSLLKDTVFKQPEFVLATQQFVTVYLDGDTDRAQKYADEFGVMAYPTTLIFTPTGDELTRLPSASVGLERYVGALQAALKTQAPVAQLITQVAAGESLRVEQWQTLAWHAWPGSGVTDRAGTLLMLSAACPEALPVERLRLRMAALAAILDGDEAIAEFDRDRYLSWIDQLLQDPQAARANLDFLLHAHSAVVKNLTDADGRRDTLIARWLAAIQHVRMMDNLAISERLDTWSAELSLIKLRGDGVIFMQPAVLAAVAAANDTEKPPQRRQAMVSSAAYLLTAAGLGEYATKLLKTELVQSESPYYFMSSLANQAEKAGQNDAALAWYKKAWQQSTGPATRLQWGSSYLSAQLRLQPEDEQAIALTAKQLVAELAEEGDALHGRTRVRLERLSTSLQDWSADVSTRLSIVARRNAELDNLCTAQLPEGDQRQMCLRLFNAAGEASTF